MTYIISGMPSNEARAYRNGALDAYGNAPEQAISSGSGVPCRHCLKNVPEGAEYLIFAYRPFAALQPYAETGPIFLCKDQCDAPQRDELPEVVTYASDFLIKGYTADQRIKYGTGAIIPKKDVQTRISQLLESADLSFVDIRSSQNNCWLARAKRAS